MTFDEAVAAIRESGSMRGRYRGNAGRLFVGPTGSIQLRYDQRKRWEVFSRGAVEGLAALEVKVGNRYERGVITGEEVK